MPGVIAFVISFPVFAALIVFIPFFCRKLINENKPQGSSEDPEYRYDEEGKKVPTHDPLILILIMILIFCIGKVRYSEHMYNLDIQTQMDQDSNNYNPWAFLFDGYKRDWAMYKVQSLPLTPTITITLHPNSDYLP